MGWPLSNLGDLCDIFTDGDWIESKSQSLEGVRLIQTGNIGGGSFKDRRDKARFISLKTFADLKCTEIYQGDCLVSRLPDPVGRSCILPETGDRMITAVDCSILRFKKDKLAPDFFNYFTQSIAYLNKVESLTSGATRKRISRKNLGLIEVPTPSIPEQKRIVAILDQAFAEIDKARANAEQNLKNARELFESYLKQVFSQRGEGWCNEQLGCLLQDRPRNGWSPPAKNHSENGVPVLTLSSVTGFKFKVDKIKFTSAPTKLDAHYWVENDDLLITRSNTPELVGHVAICSNISTPTIYPDLIMKLKLDSKKVMVRFIYYQLRSDKLRRIITSSAQGANPTMKKINQGIVQGLPLAYPSLEVQKEIVEALDSIYKVSLDLEKQYCKKIVKLDELKKSILQKAFSGELTNNDGKGVAA